MPARDRARRHANIRFAVTTLVLLALSAAHAAREKGALVFDLLAAILKKAIVARMRVTGSAYSRVR